MGILGQLEQGVRITLMMKPCDYPLILRVNIHGIGHPYNRQDQRIEYTTQKEQEAYDE